MARGQFKYLNVYGPDGRLILEKAKLSKVAIMFNISINNLYDIANLEKKVDNHKISYYSNLDKKQRFFCQKCGKNCYTKPIIKNMNLFGSLKLCSVECANLIKYEY